MCLMHIILTFHIILCWLSIILSSVGQKMLAGYLPVNYQLSIILSKIKKITLKSKMHTHTFIYIKLHKRE